MSVVNAQRTTFAVLGVNLVTEEVRRNPRYGSSCTVFEVKLARYDLASHASDRERRLTVIARPVEVNADLDHPTRMAKVEQVLYLREDWYAQRFGMVTIDPEWLSQWFGVKTPRKRDRSGMMADFYRELATRLNFEDDLL